MQLLTPAPTPETTGTAQPAPVRTVEILVARTAIAPGMVITAAMLDKQPWPEALVLDSFIVSGSPNADIVGKVAHASFQAREPLISSKLGSPSDAGFLAANLPAGMRAVTISTDAVSGVAGFVFAGDRVDILFTHNIPHQLKPSADKTATDKPEYAEILAANVPVLAVNSREGLKEDGGTANPIASTAPNNMTLQVSDIQAEKIRLAEKNGTLSVALRSVNDRENPSVATPTDLPSLTQIHGQTDREEPTLQADTVMVIRGGDFAGDAQTSGSTHPLGGNR